MMASFVYVSFVVMAVLPKESLKLMISVFAGTGLMPDSARPSSLIVSLVEPTYLPYVPRSLIDTHSWSPLFQ
ncbi:hypothetical protein BN3658_02640 [Coriobacteriaceae bacterium CHKCI002]|nr:hypothetical protein BN3658_02640 [Coriobacteriaceae bacterium CHKCI002]